MAVFVLGGTVKGVLGFGYSVAVTSVLALFVEPHVAVTVMILPMLVANIGLLTELDLSDLKSCAGRFWYNIVAAAVGASLGMTFLGG
ncbi:MAG: sulfite exporter TauE/SafE family protein, partial [Halobacteria archaeon]|nr:sulfite exporter TauE/SafE family protein [Halobacteria archaeon]